MENVLLIRYGEVHLKGLNRPYFERKLIERIKLALSGLNATVKREQGRIYAFGIGENDNEKAIDMLTRVFGIHSLSPSYGVEKGWDTICRTALEVMKQEAAGGKRTFKVFARRSDKQFFMNSQSICRELGGYILDNMPELSVDIHNPEICLSVEIRDMAYIYTKEIPCAGGMPAGTAGRGALLLSGGIDSPVAGYMLAKRGLE